MPIPKPTLIEDKESFMRRCMDNELMVSEFGQPSQREAVCSSQWSNARESESKAVDKKELDKVYKNYTKSTNMSASELEEWAETDCSKKASLDRSPIKRNLKLLRKNKSEWTEEDVKDANKTIGFIARMKENLGGESVVETDDGVECGTKAHISLKNWAYDSKKNKGLNNLSGKKTMQKAKLEDLNVGDAVKWSAGEGSAVGIIRKIMESDFDVPDSDIIITGSEEDPAIVIEILAKVEESSNVYEPTGELVGHKAETLTKVDLEVKKNLNSQFQLYKKGLGEQPIVKSHVRINRKANEDGSFGVTLTKEIYDRDDEVVDVKGVEIDNYVNNPVLIDNHNQQGSVVKTVLGSIQNVRKTEQGGVSSIEGDMKFASTQAGTEARKLVEEGHVNTVSIGFGVKEYDHGEKRILKSELYETSLVIVPSNTGALIKSNNNSVSEVAKKLANYEEIHPVIKEYRRVFKEFSKMLEIERKDSELENIAEIRHNLIKTLNSISNSENQDSKKKNKSQEVENQPENIDYDSLIKNIDIDRLQKALKKQGNR